MEPTVEIQKQPMIYLYRGAGGHWPNPGLLETQVVEWETQGRAENVTK